MEQKKPESTRPEKAKPASGNTGLKVLLIVSLLLNIGMAAGLFMMFNKSTEQDSRIAELTGEVTSKDAEVVSKTQELQNIKLDLERIKEERERLGLENDSLDQQILTLDGYIKDLKRSSSINASKRRELEKLVANLNNQILEKTQQIATLTSLNDSLSTGLSSLSVEKQRLGDSLAYTANALAYAAVLKAEAVQVVGLKENGKEVVGEELKGSKIDRLKVTFKLADNKAAKQNQKVIYVSLTTPKGEVFSDPNNGGGLLTLVDGTDALYTMNQAINFDNSSQKLTFTMLKGFNYTPGTYKLAIYSEGYKIGDGTFKVK